MILFTGKEIQNKVKEISDRINNQEYGEIPVFICVLNGGFMFFTDLVKQIKSPCYIDFMQAKSYEGTEQYTVKILKDLSLDVDLLKNKNIYLIDDIYDSGNTINYLIEYLNQYNPKSITPVTLFKRWSSDCSDLIYGFELKNELFLVGYGLNDSENLNRNIPFIFGTIIED
jgi:hypoxanthine phosphoribosyltransferase